MSIVMWYKCVDMSENHHIMLKKYMRIICKIKIFYNFAKRKTLKIN